MLERHQVSQDDGHIQPVQVSFLSCFPACYALHFCLLLLVNMYRCLSYNAQECVRFHNVMNMHEILQGLMLDKITIP